MNTLSFYQIMWLEHDEFIKDIHSISEEWNMGLTSLPPKKLKCVFE